MVSIIVTCFVPLPVIGIVGRLDERDYDDTALNLLATNLRRLRHAKGLSLHNPTSAAEINRSYLSQLEKVQV